MAHSVGPLLISRRGAVTGNDEAEDDPPGSELRYSRLFIDLLLIAVKLQLRSETLPLKIVLKSTVVDSELRYCSASVCAGRITPH